MARTAEKEIQNIGSAGRRPKGITVKQWRLALLYPRAESAYAALIQAGYTHNTASKTSSKILDLVGTKRAFEIQERNRADTARGLLSVGKAALASNISDLHELEPRDRLAVGLQAYKLAHELGENIEQQGDGNRWRMRVRRACMFMRRLTELRLTTIPPSGQCPCCGSAAATVAAPLAGQQQTQPLQLGDGRESGT